MITYTFSHSTRGLRQNMVSIPQGGLPDPVVSYNVLLIYCSDDETFRSKRARVRLFPHVFPFLVLRLEV